MAEFKVTIEAIWQKDGAFEDIGDGHLLEKQDDDESEEDENMEWSFATSFFNFFFWMINCIGVSTRDISRYTSD